MSTDVASHVNPRPSEEFLAPSHCPFRDDDDVGLNRDAYTTPSDNAERERMVCAIGLDFHLELNVVSEEGGTLEPRMKPFNPRMHSPACPPEYYGVQVDDDTVIQTAGDPVALGKRLADKRAVDPSLYDKIDPRKTSKCCVIRDYGCKVPIDLADTDKLARAVLNHYPDQYVSFLGDFVSNLFGKSMRTYLTKQRDMLTRLIEQPEMLHRTSWAAYMSVRGVDTKQDKSLRNADDLIGKLNTTTHTGHIMTGKVPTDDYLNVSACIRMHIETLTEMIDTYCRGFGSKELHVLAMMWWCNDQGRHLCQDLQLLRYSDRQPNYEDIQLVVPISFAKTGAGSKPMSTNPSMRCDTRFRAYPDKVECYQVQAQKTAVGTWCGVPHGSVFLNQTELQRHWGWGHACNVLTSHPDAAGTDRYAHVEYDGTNDEVSSCLHDVWVDDTWGHSMISPSEEPTMTSMRNSLKVSGDGTAPRLWRGSEAAPTKFTYATVPTDVRECKHDTYRPHSTLPTIPFDIYRLSSVIACRTLDPFFANDRIGDSSRFPVEIFGGMMASDVARLLPPSKFLLQDYHRLPFRILRPIPGSKGDPLSLIKACQLQLTEVMDDVLFLPKKKKHDDKMDGLIPLTDGKHISMHLNNVALEGGDYKKVQRLQHRLLCQYVVGPVFAWMVADCPGDSKHRITEKTRVFRAAKASPSPPTMDMPKEAAMKDFVNYLKQHLFMEATEDVFDETFVLETDGSLKEKTRKTFEETQSEHGDFTEDQAKYTIQLLELDEATMKNELRSGSIPDFSDILEKKIAEVRGATHAPPSSASSSSARHVPSDLQALKTLLEKIEERGAVPPTGYDMFDATCMVLKVMTKQHTIAEKEALKVFWEGRRASEDFSAYPDEFPTELLCEHPNQMGFYVQSVEAAKKLQDDINKTSIVDVLLEELKRLNKRLKTTPLIRDTLLYMCGARMSEETTYGKTYRTSTRFHIQKSNILKSDDHGDEIEYNEGAKPQMFAMLDAAGLLWNARCETTPGDVCSDEKAAPCNMHYWCRNLAESFVSARESHLLAQKDWEHEVKYRPNLAFPSHRIGSLCNRSWRTFFPLLPANHDLRGIIGRMRRLDILWGELSGYQLKENGLLRQGAWMPLSVHRQMHLYRTVGLFNEKYRVPRNPWLPEQGQGLCVVFNQSYHSAFFTDSWRAEHFDDWLDNACKYQTPNEDSCVYPFSQYGGTPVEADFTFHAVEVDGGNPEEDKSVVAAKKMVHKRRVHSRFGFTGAMRLGQSFEDTGLLQDMYSASFRPYARVDKGVDRTKTTPEVRISNFMAYARNHAIIALASCNYGTEEASVPRIVRNVYRMFVDTYECMSTRPHADGVPVILGFLPQPVTKATDRPVLLYAGTLDCINEKLANYCVKANADERVCHAFKQVYLNDAALLFSRLLRERRVHSLHVHNYKRACLRRPNYEWTNFQSDLIKLQDSYIDFLQTTLIGMLIESGADLKSVPLHILEPRELEVPLYEEDVNVIGNDFLTPRTQEIIKTMDMDGHTLNRTQLAILSLVPPNNRILGTMRLSQNPQLVDLEHVRKQIQRDTMESNRKVWQKYSEALVSAAFAQKLLEVDGPTDPDIDIVEEPKRFSMNMFKDPIKEAESVHKRMTSKLSQASSSTSQTQRAQQLRQQTGPDSVLALSKSELDRALNVVRKRVDNDYDRQGGNRPKQACLEALRIPDHVKRMLRNEMQQFDASVARGMFE